MRIGSLSHRSLIAATRRNWSPAGLFPPSAAGLWLDIQDITTMFQDAAGVTPAVINGPVGLIRDKSGKGNHLAQATSSAKPTLKQDAAGKYYLQFDGVDDGLSVTFSAAIDNCTMTFAGPSALTVKYPLTLGTSFELHTGPCYGILLINRQLTAAELGSVL